MKVIRINQSGSIDLVDIKKKDYEYYCIQVVGSSATWRTDTVLENFGLVYNDISEPIEELINKNAEKLEPNAWNKHHYHAYIGDCVVVKTKPFHYKNGLIGTREISCTKDDYLRVKEFLESK